MLACRVLQNIRDKMPLLEKNSQDVADTPLSKVNEAVKPNNDSAIIKDGDSSTPKNLNLDINPNACMDEAAYDGLLDELLSDDAEHSPKEIILDENMLSSPTFQKFWNSAEDEDECPIPLPQRAGIDDASVSFYYEDKAEEREQEYGQRFFGNGVSENVMQATLAPSPDAILSVSPSESDEQSLEQNKNRDPSANIDHQNLYPTPKLDHELSVNPIFPMHENKRRLSTGSMPSYRPELDLSGSLEMKGSQPNLSESGTNKSSLPDALMIQASHSSSTEASEDLRIKASNSTSTETSKGLGNKPPILDLEIHASVSGVENKPSTSPTSDSSQMSAPDEVEEEDPYEWAYEVWKRKGLMAGTPKGRQIAATSSDSSINLSQQASFESKRSKKSTSTNRSGNSAGSSEVTRLRGPKDRLSLPTKIGQRNQRGNTAGFSILLSRWKEKSEDKPNAHILSPRDRSPGRTQRTDFVGNSYGPSEYPSSARSFNRDATIIDRAPMLSPSMQREAIERELEEQRNASVQAEYVGSATAAKDTVVADRTPMLSPRKQREPIEKNSGPRKLSVETNQAIINDNAPVLSQGKQRESVEKDLDEQRKSVEKEELSPPELATTRMLRTSSNLEKPKRSAPSKDKNALSRFLQRTKPTPSKQHVTMQSVDENSALTSLDDISRDLQHLTVARPADDSQGHFPPSSLDLSGLESPVPPPRNDDRSSRRSFSPMSRASSIIPLFSPADDTLLEPKDVMRGHRRQSSEISITTKNTKKTRTSQPAPSEAPLLSAPFQEIFILRDGEGDHAAASPQIALGMSMDDLKSTADSVCHQTIGPQSSHKMHFTNLPDILETKADSMSFDSQSQVTHISFRTETLRNLDNKVSAIAMPPKTPKVQAEKDQEENGLPTPLEVHEQKVETPTRKKMIPEMGSMIGATPDYSERPWRKDLLVRNVTKAMDKARGSKFECDCEYSLAMFSEDDEMVNFFLPLVAVTCSCRKSKKLVNPEDPTSLENILRPWQISFLRAFGITKGDQLVKAHHRSAR
jgi:hypothetical protein